MADVQVTIDGIENITIQYMGSRLYDDVDLYFFCIHKNHSYQLQSPQITTGIRITDSDMMCGEQLENYMNIEIITKYLILMRPVMRTF